MGQEKEAAYSSLLAQASELYTTDYDGMVALLDEARTLYPERMDADRQQTYALYLNGKWQDCIDFGSDALQNYGEDMIKVRTRTPGNFAAVIPQTILQFAGNLNNRLCQGLRYFRRVPHNWR